jgi:hypothetical protein
VQRLLSERSPTNIDLREHAPTVSVCQLQNTSLRLRKHLVQCLAQHGFQVASPHQKARLEFLHSKSPVTMDDHRIR